jgi:hypothetical protein
MILIYTRTFNYIIQSSEDENKILINSNHDSNP